MIRDHIYVSSELLGAKEYSKASKYKSLNDNNDIHALIKKLKEIGLLPLELSLLTTENNPRLNLKKYKKILLASCFSPCNKLSLKNLQEIMDLAVPAVPVNNELCDFIIFDEKAYNYTCIQRQAAIKDQTFDQDICYKKSNGTPFYLRGEKLCDSSYNDQEIIEILFKFHECFPNVRINDDEGRLPLFLYSYFLDYILFESFFGNEIFWGRFNFVYPDEEKKRRLAEGRVNDYFYSRKKEE
ncbi:MAG: hypothetical protein HZB61_05445 [Nitrospirae bacterium]|nr:hypothetical protein [Nitrospirota bacterium]